MANKRSIFLLLLCSFVTSVIAQENKRVISGAIITLEPLALADVFDGASCRVGAEVKLSKRFSLALTSITSITSKLPK